jgi:rod shape-determining protein MreD
MMIKKIFWTVIFGIVAAVLQSTLLSRFTLYRAVPDIALGILVYSAYVNGMMTGQLSGFFYGIALDFISAAPIGLNVLVRTLVGAFSGLLKGSFILGVFFLPMLLCALATLFKAIILFLLNLFFGDIVPAYPLLAPVLWAEMALNIITAPFLFAFLRRFKSLFMGKEQV